MEFVLMEVESGIATLTLNRPKALNAINTELLQELHDRVDELKDRKDIRVIILTGSGSKSFVAGADISEMCPAAAVEGKIMAELADETFTMLENLPQVTIAAVNGYALGGGCELSMSCDIRIASENAKFGQPECGLGILPGFGGTQRLARLVGKGRAMEMIFTCNIIDAQEAYRMGLVNHVTSAEDLMPTCQAMAKNILTKGSYAIALAKSVICHGLDTDLASGLAAEATAFGLSFATHDKVEGMSAFLEKRRAELIDF